MERSISVQQSTIRLRSPLLQAHLVLRQIRPHTISSTLATTQQVMSDRLTLPPLYKMGRRYICHRGVVGTIVITNDATANHAGWTLGVIYQNGNLPFVTCLYVREESLFKRVRHRLLRRLLALQRLFPERSGKSAVQCRRDANRTGDQALFGATSATSVALSGPNNLAANFCISN